MRNVKRYLITIGVMIITAAVALLVVSVLTYWLKWQADKAMIGIIGTYVLTGVSGGVYFARSEKRKNGSKRKLELGKSMVEAVKISTIFIITLVLCSSIGFEISFYFSSRFILIWLLIASGFFLGLRR